MAAPTQADREGFAALAARVLVTRGIATSAEPRLSAFALDLATDGGPRTLSLHDAMTEALGAPPEERTAVITACARWQLGQASGTTWNEVRAHVRPVVRNAWFGTETTIQQTTGLDDHLSVFAAFRVPCEGLRYVTAADLEEWGVDEEEVLRTAGENLRRHLDATNLEMRVIDGVEILVSSAGVEASSLVLAMSRLLPVLRASGGHPLVAIPDRDTLLARRAEPGTMPFLVDAALERFASAAQPLSPVVLPAGDEGPAARSSLEALQPFAVAKRRLLLETYLAQGRILRSRGGDEEIPDPEERIGDLVCSWNEGTHALLPECASVKLVTKRGRRTETLEWYAVRNFVGSTFQQEPDLFPPRWRAFPWKRDDVRAFDTEEEDEPDPEMEAHFAEQEAEWADDEGSEPERDYDEYEGWQEGDPDVMCPFCGSGLRGEKVCEVCGRSPAEARAAIKASVAPTHAIRVLQALVDGKHLEMANARALPAIGRAIAETLDGSTDWEPQAAALSARLLSMEEVAEVFLDDAALAELLARTATGPTTPDAQLAARMQAVERAEAEKFSGATGAVLAKRILREMWSEGALDADDEDPLDRMATPLGARIGGLTDARAIASEVFSFVRARFAAEEVELHVESAEELVEMAERALVHVPAAPVAGAPDEPPPDKPDAPKLPAAKRLLRRLLDEGHVEMVAGGSQELVENAIAELLASDDAKDPAALHALLDEMDEDVVLFADAETLAKLPTR